MSDKTQPEDDQKYVTTQDVSAALESEAKANAKTSCQRTSGPKRLKRRMNLQHP